MENKYVCIHGHFYQPPRENAWLEEIEQQETATPFHDWNERINYECYATNASARILNSSGQITRIRNNYSRISYNIGPTLLSYLQKADPDTYANVLAADTKSQDRFGGHGSAMAQVYSHAILPLCNDADRETQVVWGVRDFEHRYGRKPEGMWLAETAADTASLEALAAEGIKFTILAPRQMKSLRKIGATDWSNIHNDAFDTGVPYLCKLPSGNTISLFFYHGGVSQAVAFEGLLNSGKALAQRVCGILNNSDAPQLAHIATDGESYGHHHRHGEMALADCLNYIEEQTEAQLTNYGQFLELFPPQFEAQIHENSSWSCYHGVERWRSNCGCNSGGSQAGHQRWRAPLRKALDWLRDEIAPIFEEEAAKLLRNPRAARNDYISVILDRSEANISRFLYRHAAHPLNDDEQVKLLRLLEMQRQTLLMYTSCGWFFDDVSGIETVQILQYACRAIDYAAQISNRQLEPTFKLLLAEAPSNIASIGDAARCYENNIQTARVDLRRVGIHYGIMSLFEQHPERLEFFNYTARNEHFERLNAGNQTLVLGRSTVRSRITYSEKTFTFVALYLGQLNIIGNISTEMQPIQFDDICQQIKTAFRGAELTKVLALMSEHFDPSQFSIWQLFKDEHQKLINRVLSESLQSLQDTFRATYEANYQLMLMVQLNKMIVPEPYRDAVQHVIGNGVSRFFSGNDDNLLTLQGLLDEKTRWQITLPNEPALKISIGIYFQKRIGKLKNADAAIADINLLADLLELLKKQNIKYNFYKAQNAYFDLMKDFEKGRRDMPNELWLGAFIRLGALLSVATQRLSVAALPAG